MTETIYSFGTWVKQRRRALRLTQHELAHLVGCSTELLRKIEADARRPSTQIAELLAPALGLPANDHASFVRAARAQLAIDQLPIPGRKELPVLTPSPPTFTLPALPTRLVGREQDLNNIRALLNSNARLVTLIGPPGVGKTTLALAAAQALLQADAPTNGRMREPTKSAPSRFQDGAIFVPLAPISDPALVVHAIARALGVAEQPGRPLLDSLRSFLAQRRLLLLLDNLEQILDCAPVIAELLAAAPLVRVLATSRASLRLRGEYLHSVAPLAVPPSTRIDQAAEFHQFAAIELFVQRAQAVQQDFVVTNANQAIIAAIVRRLDGLPLAIELAAARIRLFSAHTLLERLSVGGLPELRDGPRDAPTRQQTLHNAVAWSYRLLAAAEQRVFRQLGVFHNGWTIESAVAVVDGRPEIITAKAKPLVLLVDTLHTLLDHSLITCAGDRFGMLETLREFALEQLRAAGEEQAARQNHAAYFAWLAEQAQAPLHGPLQVAWIKRLDDEQDNWRAALRWGLANHPTISMQLANGLWEYWQLNGNLIEAHTWLTTALQQTSETPALLHARALQCLGYCIHLLDDNERAVALLEESIEIFQANSDTSGVAYGFMNLALPLRKQSRFHAARQVLSKSLRLFVELGDPYGQAWVGFLRGLIAMDLDELDLAWELLNAARMAFATCQDPYSTDWTCYNLGHVARLRGNLDEAEQFYTIALAMLQRLNDRTFSPEVFICLGHLARLRGDYRRAQTIYATGIMDLYRAGSLRRVADCLDGMAAVAQSDEQFTITAQLMGAAIKLRETIAIPIAPSERTQYQQQIQNLRQQLPDPHFTVAWEVGRALALEQAIVLATQLPLL
jgi:predicted ATPase/transcriptional regulator with XRE-family HTH domain